MEQMFEVEGVMYTQEQMYQGVKLANGTFLVHKRKSSPPRVLTGECEFIYPLFGREHVRDIEGKDEKILS